MNIYIPHTIYVSWFWGSLHVVGLLGFFCNDFWNNWDVWHCCIFNGRGLQMLSMPLVTMLLFVFREILRYWWLILLLCWQIWDLPDHDGYSCVCRCYYCTLVTIIAGVVGDAECYWSWYCSRHWALFCHNYLLADVWELIINVSADVENYLVKRW